MSKKNKRRRNESRPVEENELPQSQQADLGRLLVISIVVFLIGCAVYVFWPSSTELLDESVPDGRASTSSLTSEPPARSPGIRGWTEGRLAVYWDLIPASVRQATVASIGMTNIHPNSYAGPESCRKCHQENYENWSQHPHRWMNALATDETVKGDFNNAVIKYRGGLATFQQEGDQRTMRLERDNVLRVYQVNQTIGSRFFQYYVGKGIEGPEPPEHDYYQKDHVLPFGYWLDEKMWDPTVHLLDEMPDETRWDPFKPIYPEDRVAFIYAKRCNYCHTTFPLADMMLRTPELIGTYAPIEMHFDGSSYLAEVHPQVWSGDNASQTEDETVVDVIESVKMFDAPQHAATLGVSCEACHLGARAHAEGKLKRPPLLPNSPHLRLYTSGEMPDSGRTHQNVNWACSRCHSGPRPSFAGGISTWNSTEYADAARGACYSQLTCIHCHNPHQAIGPKWSKTPDQDDASCLQCHKEYSEQTALVAHTHHPPGSQGSRCMNCHMPKMNEGMQDVVRTHMIFSPTMPDLIEANHPNACNLCHLDKPIDWTIQQLKDWYGATFQEMQIAANYPHRDGPVGTGWLKHDFESVRLVAAWALSQHKAAWALPQLIDSLDDRFLLNRQFTYKGLKDQMGVDFESFGYRYYMMNDERQESLAKLREYLLDQDDVD